MYVNGRLMLTKLGYIDGKWQTIYGIHTDPMGIYPPFSHHFLAKKKITIGTPRKFAHDVAR